MRYEILSKNGFEANATYLIATVEAASNLQYFALKHMYCSRNLDQTY